MNIILFDGVCNLCNSTVQFIIKNDIKNNFKFSSLQSDFGKNFLIKNGLDKDNYSSIILIVDKDKYYTKSSAILKIYTKLRGYKWMGIFFLIPKFLRDLGYSIISKNRYLIFGKAENSCLLPSQKLNDKFIL